MATNYPTEVKILDVVYSIEYVDNPADVDIHKRTALWGQVDYWTRSIRIYVNDRQLSSVWHTLWHEIVHAICQHLNIEADKSGDLADDEKAVDLLATGINSVLHDNDWLK
jgi:hypothetical protein